MGTVTVLVLVLVMSSGLVAIVARRVRPTATTTRSRQDDWGPLLDELERARRYDRGFALLELADNALRVEGRRLRSDAGVLLELRRTDTAWGGPDRLHVLVPEATRLQLDGMLDRLRRSLHHTTDVRVACFPEDGLTARALVAVVDPAASTLPREEASRTVLRDGARPASRVVEPALEPAREAS